MYLKRNKNRLSLLSAYLADYEKRFFLRELSRNLNIPLKTVQSRLADLEKAKILLSKLEGKNKYFGLNKENPLVKMELLKAEIEKTVQFLEQNTQFNLFLKELNESTPVLVFGSYAKNTQKKDSDLDLLIIGKIDENLLSFLPFNVHKIELSESTFQKALEKEENLIKEIRLHHVILNYHSFFVDSFWRQNAKR